MQKGNSYFSFNEKLSSWGLGQLKFVNYGTKKVHINQQAADQEPLQKTVFKAHLHFKSPPFFCGINI